MKRKGLFFVLTFVPIVILCKLFVGKRNQLFNKQFEEFVSTPIQIPYDKLEKRTCYTFIDSLVDEKDIRLVFYLDSVGCMNCQLSEMLAYAKLNEDIFRKIVLIYIFSVKHSHTDFLYRELCKQRVEGEVYFDTCNAFMMENPMFPLNKKFHTFALDKKNNVIFVGNPAINSNNEEVFKKIVHEYSSRK